MGPRHDYLSFVSTTASPAPPHDIIPRSSHRISPQFLHRRESCCVADRFLEAPKSQRGIGTIPQRFRRDRRPPAFDSEPLKGVGTHHNSTAMVPPHPRGTNFPATPDRDDIDKTFVSVLASRPLLSVYADISVDGRISRRVSTALWTTSMKAWTCRLYVRPPLNTAGGLLTLPSPQYMGIYT